MFTFFNCIIRFYNAIETEAHINFISWLIPTLSQSLFLFPSLRVPMHWCFSHASVSDCSGWNQYMNVLFVHSKWCFYANVHGIGFCILLRSRTHQEPHSNKYIIVCFCSTSTSPHFFALFLFLSLFVSLSLCEYWLCAQ